MFAAGDGPFGSRTPGIAWQIDASQADKEVHFIDVIWYHSDLKDVFEQPLEVTGGGGKGDDEIEAPSALTCCTEERLEAGYCQQLNRPTFDATYLGENVDRFHRVLRDDENRQLWDSLQQYVGGAHGDPTGVAPDDRLASGTIPIARSGFHYVHFFNCQNGTEAGVGGIFEWMNPHGHLAASQVSYIPIYIVLTIVYFALATANGLLLFMYWKDAKRVQTVIQVLLCMSFLENMVYTIDWCVYNYQTGEVSLFLNVLSVLLYSTRSVASFIMLLIVAMGWQVWRHEISPAHQLAIVGYASIMFFLTFLYALLSMFTYTPDTQHIDVPEAVLVIAGTLTTLADFGCVLWIGFSLATSIRTLERAKQRSKAEMFRTLAKVLVAFTCCAVILFLFEAGFTLGGAVDPEFRTWWIFGATWDFLWLAATIFIWWTLRPSMENLTRLSFEEIPEETENAAEPVIDESARELDEMQDVAEDEADSGAARRKSKKKAAPAATAAPEVEEEAVESAGDEDSEEVVEEEEDLDDSASE
jgi:hypothetical protein